MFKNFDSQNDRAGTTLIKSSVQKALLQKIELQYPLLSPEILEAVLPKKQQITLIKFKEHLTLVMSPVLMEPVFFQLRDGPLFPTLRFLHMAGGNFMPKLQIDKGGIKFVLKGADVFAKGIVSNGGKIFEPLGKDVPVQVQGEGKQLPFAIGITAQTTQEMMEVQTGVGITLLHHIGDDLWNVTKWRV
jgi:PUA domain protein